MSIVGACIARLGKLVNACFITWYNACMSDILIPEPQKIDPRVVYCPTDNPNRMTPEVMAELRQSIRTQGFVQPVFVVDGGPDDYKYTVVDGHHRTEAMIELGASYYYGIVADTVDDAKRLMARLGLNRIRGNLDLVDVSRDLELIMNTYQIPMDEILGTGFEEDEIQALLSATEPVMPEDLLGELPDTEPPAKVRKSTSKKNFTIKFNAEVDRVRAEEALMAHADGTDDPAIGLLKLLGIDPEED